MSSHSTTDNADAHDQRDCADNERRAASLLEMVPFLRFFSRFAEQQYRPEKHYMRGPGPKCKAKKRA